MIRVIQAVRVGKVGAGQAQGLRLGVHRVHAALNASANVGGQHIGTIVGAGKLRAVHHVFQGDNLAGLQGNVGGIGVQQRVHRLFAHGHAFIPVAARLLSRQPQRHDLGGRGRVHFLIRVLLDQNLPGVCVHHHIGPAGNRRRGILRKGRQTEGRRQAGRGSQCAYALYRFLHQSFRSCLQAAGTALYENAGSARTAVGSFLHT